MSPLYLVGIFFVAVSYGDVSHIVQKPLNENARDINLLAFDPANEQQFWWMSKNSPLRRAVDSFNSGCGNNGCGRTPALAANPFLNGEYSSGSSRASAHFNAQPERVDLSANPFFNGGFQSGKVHAGTSQQGVPCQGAGHICVKKSDCINGVINNDGFGLIETSKGISFCNPRTESCCRYKEYDFVNQGKTSFESQFKLGHEPKLTISNLGESGADINSLSASTAKPTRDVAFGGTVDLSNVVVNDDVRFASTIRGPAYLPPVENKPTPVVTLPPPRCGPTEQLINGRCVPRATPPPPPRCGYDEQLINGRCVPRPTPPPPPQCGFDEQLINGRCVPRPTPPPPPRCAPTEQLINGRCVPRPTPPPPPRCGFDEQLINGRCVPRPTPPPPPRCAPTEQLINGRCVPRPTPPPQPSCAPFEQLVNGRCIPKCTGNQKYVNGRCQVICGPNEYEQNGVCLPRPTPPVTQPPTYLPPSSPSCGPNEYFQNGRCIPRTVPTTPPPRPTCGYNQQFIGGRCQCVGNTVEQNGQCVAITRPPPPPPTRPPAPTCRPGERFVNGRCERPPPPPPTCGPGERFVNGRCERPPPPPPTCGPGERFVNGRCERPPPPPPTCGPGERFVNGRCERPPPPPPTCGPGERFVNGRCERPPPPPPTCGPGERFINGRCQIQCGPNQQLVNGRCQIVCTGNTYEQNGVCIPRPTIPATQPPIYLPPATTQRPQCGFNEQLINGRCVPRPTPPPPPRCQPYEQLVNGRCVPRPTPPPPPTTIRCAYNEDLINGRCVPRPTPPPPTTIRCAFNEQLINGRCVPRPTPPPVTQPPTQGTYLPPATTCRFDQILSNGICVPKCAANQILQNGICVAIPTRPPPTRPVPTRPTGYVYPQPTPSFEIPTTKRNRPVIEIGEDTEGNDLRETYISTTTTRRPTQPEYVPAPSGNVEQLAGCAAALKCVQEIYCSAEGFISPVPVVFTKDQEYSRVPLTDCVVSETGDQGKCCRDPDYKDPWPSANLVNGIDNGQYREDPSLGQYNAAQTNRLTRSHPAKVAQREAAGKCGTRHFDAQPRGPGAYDAHFAEIPWQAMILREANRSLLCGGAIIRKNAVITAAHCVEGLQANDVLVKGGEWKLGIDEEPLPFQIIKVKRIIVHPNYDSASQHNDLAVLLLDESFRFAKNIDSICLPQPNAVPQGKCITTGWGKKVLQIHLKDAIMRLVNVDVLDAQSCTSHCANNFPELVGKIGQTTVCAQSTADQCKVDHGSALACTTDGTHYTLHGIFSWDSGCKDQRQVGGYILPDVEWIESVLAKRV